MYIISASYGNDSVAMIRWAYERGLKDVHVVYIDTVFRYWTATDSYGNEFLCTDTIPIRAHRAISALITVHLIR